MSTRWTEEDWNRYQALREMQKRTLNSTVVDSPSRPLRGTDRVASRRDYKAELVQQLGLVGIQVEPEFMFAKPRKWRADWRVKGLHVLIEFEGGLFHKGKQGHSSVSGILRDIEKYNAAALNGWMVVRVTPKHVVSGQALWWIEQAVVKATRQVATVAAARKHEGCAIRAQP